MKKLSIRVKIFMRAEQLFGAISYVERILSNVKNVTKNMVIRIWRIFGDAPAKHIDMGQSHLTAKKKVTQKLWLQLECSSAAFQYRKDIKTTALLD